MEFDSVVVTQETQLFGFAFTSRIHEEVGNDAKFELARLCMCFEKTYGTHNNLDALTNILVVSHQYSS